MLYEVITSYSEKCPKGHYTRIRVDRLLEADRNPSDGRRKMSHKTYFLVCGAVFFVVAAAHLTRLIMGWEITIASYNFV